MLLLSKDTASYSTLLHGEWIRSVILSALFAVWMIAVKRLFGFIEGANWFHFLAFSATLPWFILLCGAQHFHGFQSKHLHLKQDFDWLSFMMAWTTKGYEVFEAVCLFVILVTARNIAESYKRLLVMYVKFFAVISLCNPAMLAGVVISLSCGVSLLFPIFAVITLVTASPCVTICAGFVFRFPHIAALHVTEKVFPSHARRSNHGYFPAIVALHRNALSSVWTWGVSSVTHGLPKKVLPARLAGFGVQAKPIKPIGERVKRKIRRLVILPEQLDYIICCQH
jgi:hypothetical protein